MKQNKEKLDQMVEAVMRIKYPNGRPDFTYWDGRNYDEYAETLRTALTPFCMEMTDEEIMKKSQSYNTDKIETGAALQQGIIIGAKFIRDGK